MNKLFLILKNKAKNFDIFELRNSVLAYYFFIFLFIPLVSVLIFPPHKTFFEKSLEIKHFFYLIIGFVFLAIGCFSKGPSKLADRIPNIFNREWNFKKVPYVFLGVFLADLLVKWARVYQGVYFHMIGSSFVKSPFYSLIGILFWVGPLALAIAFIFYFHLKKIGDNRFKKWRFIAWSLFIFEIIYAIPSCSRLSVIVIIITYLIVKFYMERIKFWKIAIIIILIILILFPYGNVCRHSGVLKSYVIVGGSNGASAKINVSDSINFISDSVLSRFEQSVIFAKTANAIDKEKSFWLGKDFKNFFIALGPPRFIWKNKPIISGSGNEFGRHIGFLSPDDYTTSVAPTVPGEWYANFGILGVIIGMFLTGAFCRFIFNYFMADGKNFSLSGLMIYSILWINIIKGLEDWMVTLSASLVKWLVILLIINYLFIKKRTNKLI